MIGIGVDVVDIDRFAHVLARTPRIAQRLFGAEELATVAGRADPVPALAARFAAREAAMKALGVGLGAFDFHDVQVHTAPSGAPHLVVTGRAAMLAAARGVQSWQCSLSHSRQVAVAMVVATGT